MHLPFQDRMGILSGGNWIVDRVKIVDLYPDRERLANVLSESIHNGGAAFNVLKDLALLGAPFPLAGVGLVGQDEDGDFILEQCRALSIDVAEIRQVPDLKTSRTDVMSERRSGKRTFFHFRGANAHLDLEHFHLERSRARIFHLGYLLLLDALDKIQSDGHSKAFHLLAQARALGFKTSADMVSAEDDGFASAVHSTLPAIDILFLNEIEAEKTTGIRLRGKDALESGAVRIALEDLITKGVQEWAILHLPAGACALSAKGEWVCQGAVQLPANHIVGTVGAGDAFAAGVLYGLHQEHEMAECLTMGACAAAACLTRPGSSDGVATLPACLDLGREYGFRDLSHFDHVEKVEEKQL